MKPTAKVENVDFIVPIEYHADDYGMFPTQSLRILDCHKHGNLNGVSVMPNSAYLEECMELLRPHQKESAVTVHLNLIEGHSLSAPEEVPLLTDETGIFRASFGNLLIRSFLPGRRAYREQLKKEIRAQIHAVKRFLAPDSSLRIDGHAHYHMLPVVFDALMDVIREEELPVSYIRIPREYPSLYLRNWRKLRDFAAINLVKTAVLNVLASYNLQKYREETASLSQTVFLGVFLSGRMHGENAAAVLPDAARLAEKLHCGIELLAHPGGVYEEADIGELTNSDDVAFLTSDFRRKEATMFDAKEWMKCN